MASAQVSTCVYDGFTKYVVHSREECRFEPTHEESIRSELRKRGYPILQQGENTPEDLHERDQVVHGYPGEKEEEWELAEYSSQNVHGLQSHQLITLEAQVFLETSDVGIVCTSQLFCMWSCSGCAH
jgi:hypothetical protein